MRYEGTTWKFGDNVSTDEILPSIAVPETDPFRLAKFAMAGLDPRFAEKVRPGDVIVARDNFGCGSSREHAPLALWGAGIRVVVARSIARIFYRNCINTGLLPVICPEADRIGPGARVVVDPEAGTCTDASTGAVLDCIPPTGIAGDIFLAGGLLPFLKGRGWRF